MLEFINQQIIIPAQVIVQDISSPTINEGDQASFEVTLDQPTQQETEVTLSLSDDSATGGADYDNSAITITFEDGSTDQINVGEDGTFSVSIPIGDESFVITVDTIDDDVFEGNVTITLEDNSTQIVNVNPDGSFAVTVPANEVSYNVTINTIDDDLFEGTETFTLSGSTENQNGTTSGTVTIVDDLSLIHI